MLERIARVLCRNAHLVQQPADRWRPGELDAEVDVYFPHWFDVADAVLAVLRDPTPGMVEVGEHAMGIDGSHDCEVRPGAIWQAMIDAAREGK